MLLPANESAIKEEEQNNGDIGKKVGKSSSSSRKTKEAERNRGRDNEVTEDEIAVKDEFTKYKSRSRSPQIIQCRG